MKILLDECLPLDLRHSFPSHAAHTAQWAGLKGKKNGELLLAAEAAGYDVQLTVDQGTPHQQHSASPTPCALSISRRLRNFALQLADRPLFPVYVIGKESERSLIGELDRPRAVNHDSCCGSASDGSPPVLDRSLSVGGINKRIRSAVSVNRG